MDPIEPIWRTGRCSNRHEFRIVQSPFTEQKDLAFPQAGLRGVFGHGGERGIPKTRSGPETSGPLHKGPCRKGLRGRFRLGLKELEVVQDHFRDVALGTILGLVAAVDQATFQRYG